MNKNKSNGATRRKAFILFFFSAFYADFKVLVEKQEQGKLGQRLNKEKNGFNSIVKKLMRQIKRNKIDESQSIKEQIMKVHKRWRTVEYWQAIKRTAPPYTMAKYLKGMDMSLQQMEASPKLMKIEEYTEYFG